MVVVDAVDADGRNERHGDNEKMKSWQNKEMKTNKLVIIAIALSLLFVAQVVTFLVITGQEHPRLMFLDNDIG